MLSPIVDGFVYNINLRPVCNQYPLLALAEMEDIRRAKGHRPLWIAVPPDLSQVLTARDSIEYNAPVPRGSWLYGFVLVKPFPGEFDTLTFSLLITESCSGIQLFSEYVRTDSYGQTGATQFSGIQLFPKPAVILDPGLAVELCSLSSDDSDLNIQIVLLLSTPVEEICCPSPEQRTLIEKLAGPGAGVYR